MHYRYAHAVVHKLYLSVNYGEGKNNVKFTLKQASKAQRGSRGITVLFL
jgi:hypothetical protein